LLPSSLSSGNRCAPSAPAFLLLLPAAATPAAALLLLAPAPPPLLPALLVFGTGRFHSRISLSQLLVM
jgi:hypothetical protein